MPSFVWAVFILWLSLKNGNSLPTINIPNIDKAVHFTFYFILALLMFYGWTKQNIFSSLHKQKLIKIFLLAFSYGFTMEIMQEVFTVSRHFDTLDIAANSMGAIAGSLISVKLFK